MAPAEHAHNIQKTVPHSFVPELACFDIDGTIVDSCHNLSENALHVIQSLQERGTHIALASGRPSFAAEKLISKLSITSPSMFFAGSLIIQPNDKQVLYSQTLEIEAIEHFLALGKKHGFYSELYHANGYAIEHRSELTAIHEEYLGVRPQVAPLCEFSAEPILKASFMIPERWDETKNSWIKSLFPEQSVTISYGAAHPEITFVNITAKNATRENAFTELLRLTGAAQEKSIAFGDADSDIPFIRCAQIGVAMGNASQVVKDAADYVTTDVADQGVARAMDELFTWYDLPPSQ